MKKLLLSAFALLMTLAAGAQTVTSPNGNVSVKFWLQDGRPTYEMSYKRKAVAPWSRACQRQARKQRPGRAEPHGRLHRERPADLYF